MLAVLHIVNAGDSIGPLALRWR